MNTRWSKSSTENVQRIGWFVYGNNVLLGYLFLFLLRMWAEDTPLSWVYFFLMCMHLFHTFFMWEVLHLNQTAFQVPNSHLDLKLSGMFNGFSCLSIVCQECFFPNALLIHWGRSKRNDTFFLWLGFFCVSTWVTIKWRIYLV